MSDRKIEVEIPWIQTEEFYDENLEFNDSLDLDGDVDVLGRPLAPSKILFFTDHDSYMEELKTWEAEQISDAEIYVNELSQDFPSNEHRLNELILRLKNNKLIPFVGAGMSVASGIKDWRSFLIDCAKDSALDLDEFSLKLDKGLFEICASELIDKRSLSWLNEQVEGRLGEPEEISGSVVLLPDIANNGLITTNYDPVLERVFSLQGRYLDIVYANETELLTIFSRGGDVLLKLHGDFRRSGNRVLTLEEYDNLYGDSGIDMTKNFVEFFKSVCLNSCLLFLGCSLNSDRTMDLMLEISKLLKEKEIEPPRHYAFMECCGDDQFRIAREEFLLDRMIYPIWYKKNQHGAIEEFIRYITEKRLGEYGE